MTVLVPGERVTTHDDGARATEAIETSDSFVQVIPSDEPDSSGTAADDFIDGWASRVQRWERLVGEPVRAAAPTEAEIDTWERAFSGLAKR